MTGIVAAVVVAVVVAVVAAVGVRACGARYMCYRCLRRLPERNLAPTYGADGKGQHINHWFCKKCYVATFGHLPRGWPAKPVVLHTVRYTCGCEGQDGNAQHHPNPWPWPERCFEHAAPVSDLACPPDCPIRVAKIGRGDRP